MTDAWEKDGFSVKVLYSRAGVATQILVCANGSSFLLDAGDGILRDVLKSNLDLRENIDAIFITHEHSDHVGGLFSLLNYMYLIGRTKPISIVVPEPSLIVKSFVKLVKKYAIENRGFGLSFQIDILSIADQEEKCFNSIFLKAFSVLHRSGVRLNPIGPMCPAVGYVLKYNNVRVVFSGDTSVCDSLKKEVKDADLAVLDATYTKQPTILEKHMMVEEAEEIGSLARDYMLIHRP